MNKYLIEILRLQTSVILPGFGSLMIGNTKTGKVVFNPLLKFNDGSLAKYIAEKEGIDQQAAQNQVAKFVREMEAELAKGNSYDVFQFGKFLKNKEGVVEFVQDEANSLLIANVDEKPTAQKETKGESKKVEPIVKKESTKELEKKIEATTIKEKVAEVKTADKKVDHKEDSVAKIEEKIIETKQTKNTFTPSLEDKLAAAESTVKKEVETKIEVEKTTIIVKPIEKNIPLAEASKKDPAAQEKNKFVPPKEEKLVAAETKNENPKIMETYSKEEGGAEKTPEKKLSVKEKFRKDKPQKVKNQTPNDKKKKSRAPLLIIILLILGGGATAYWFYQDEVKAFLFAGVGSDKDSTDTKKIEPKDSLLTTPIIDEVIEDTLLIEEPIIEEPVEPEKPVKKKPVKKDPVNTSSPGGTYHIIGNAFSSKENADNYAATMSSKGYSASVLGRFDNLYLVSIKSYGSREDANSGLSSVQSDAGGAWVFKYK